ncbi:MAG: FHA domain-containing protein [Pseudomonadota bacterium]
MTVKSWVLDRAHRMNGLAARGDLPPREPVGPAATVPPGQPGNRPPASAGDAALAGAAHLGAYAGLIGAIRDELEHFVASHVRLHLAIDERDRFLLTSIQVQCRDAGQPRQLLRGFMHEFKPEQVKRYLAREVIAGLPNAAAIDLSQFAGLVDVEDTSAGADEDGEYRELLEALRSTPAPVAVRPYDVSVVGRWTELDAPRPTAPVQPRAPVVGAGLTPMAGQRCEFELEDADGPRRVALQSVVPGRRYVVGKGESCDIRVNATYASRRHAELWFDNGSWWVADAGSTNGIRVESRVGAQDPGCSVMLAAEQPLLLQEGARIVLSARAEGPAGDYPWLALRSSLAAATRITPIAASAAPKTPLTAILAAPPAEPAFKLTALQSSGPRSLELHTASLPLGIGRSRNQALVVDRHHAGVSGHHLEVLDLDEDGASVLVHGDNGVWLDGAHHGPGARLHWRAGQTLVLDASSADAPACQLTLAREPRN